MLLVEVRVHEHRTDDLNINHFGGSMVLVKTFH